MAAVRVAARRIAEHENGHRDRCAQGEMCSLRSLCRAGRSDGEESGFPEEIQRRFQKIPDRRRRNEDAGRQDKIPPAFTAAEFFDIP